ncbi:AI-2E family transporter [Lewinella sp. W8]|uniref:AI-2E family transporter n=1 Tax=Lewinella sp. W8 TaxID=2528208 RepID=UPI001068120E|nr:AI-2E family transporter [Lewinella sp. W8]MTB51239.1 AI-2E family transporter [Lewinella sp. W8]
MLPLQKATYACLLFCMILCLIIYGKGFLVPVILAFVLWYLINAVNQLIRMIPSVGTKAPSGLTLAIAAITVLMITVSAGSLIGQQINAMVATAPDYRVNLEQQLTRILGGIGYRQPVNLQSITSELDISSYLGSLLSSFSAIARQFLLVLLYTLFLLVEQHTFSRKIAALRLNKERKMKLAEVLDKINRAIRTYIGVKFAASLATGLLSYVVIQLAGVDFALFWAFLIFVFNFIPTIGSIAATLFPSLIALVQFEYLTPFFIVLVGVGAIQLVIGGLLEPRLYGNALNISPFVVVLTLILWGLLWGIVGMLLCVPITVIMITLFAQFPTTRPIAVLLSQRGRV